MKKLQAVSVLIIIVLIAGNIFFASKYYSQAPFENSSSTDPSVAHKKIVDFTVMFVDKVLKSTTEVDFETRLKLENSVRELNDKDILASWQTFTDSKNETEAQMNVKNLLYLLMVKLQNS